MTNRISTKEAARLLGARQAETLALLRAARARGTKISSAYLWDAEDVKAVARALEAANLGPARPELGS